VSAKCPLAARLNVSVTLCSRRKNALSCGLPTWRRNMPLMQRCGVNANVRLWPEENSVLACSFYNGRYSRSAVPRMFQFKFPNESLTCCI